MHLLDGLIDVGNDIVDVFDTDGEADEAVDHAHRLAFLAWNIEKRHGGGNLGGRDPEGQACAGAVD